MPEEIVINARQLSKAYRIWVDPSQRLISPLLAEAGRWLPHPLGRPLQQRAKAGYRDFFALQDVSFEVKRGEAVGIVGRNGAGKSTLLQIIAGTLQSSAGSIQINGRIAALLELGAGFNPDFTGRENVHLSAAVLGLARKETENRFDDIAAFADIGDFLDQPVKTYSSGMVMRLAFAVSTCVDPDILIVDEALSVGDAPFQAKCFRRLRQLIDKGVSLLFVSHDLGTVRTICSRALWLKNGRAEMWGEATPGPNPSHRFWWAARGGIRPPAQKTATAVGGARKGPATERTTGVPALLLVPNPTFIAAREQGRIGSSAVVIENMLAMRADGSPASTVDYDETVDFAFLAQARVNIDSDLIVSVRLRDLQGNFILSAHDIFGHHRLKVSAGDRFLAKLSLRLPLHHQQYSILAGIFGFQGGESRINGTYDFSLADVWEVVEDAAFIKVNPCPAMPLPGPVHINAPLTVQVLT